MPNKRPSSCLLFFFFLSHFFPIIAFLDFALAVIFAGNIFVNANFVSRSNLTYAAALRLLKFLTISALKNA